MLMDKSLLLMSFPAFVNFQRLDIVNASGSFAESNEILILEASPRNARETGRQALYTRAARTLFLSDRYACNDLLNATLKTIY